MGGMMNRIGSAFGGGAGTGIPTVDPTTGLPQGGYMTGVSPNSPMAQAANNIGASASGPLNIPTRTDKTVKALAAGINAPALQALLNPPQPRGGPAPMPLQTQMPYVPPPQLNNQFYGG